jgi:hypothetical protein
MWTTFVCEMTIVLTRNMRKQMNKALQWKGGNVLSVGEGRQFHTMEREGLATLQVAQQ